MAEDFITRDQYRADLADIRQLMAEFQERVTTSIANEHVENARFREQVTVTIARIEGHLIRWIMAAAVVAGLIASVGKLFS